MFQGFTQKTSDFLWELAFNNERPWFMAHKAEFEECLNTPFKQLAADTIALMKERFPLYEFDVHVSRIYRDARRLFGRGPYKDHLWFSIRAGEIKGEGPSFWFEIGASEYSYGMGYFMASPTHMEIFRRAVDANPAQFERLAKDIEKLKGFKLIGPEYARPKGDRGEVINRWYNRKHIAIESAHDFGGDLLTAELPRILVDGYEKLLPMHDFFVNVYRLGRTEK